MRLALFAAAMAASVSIGSAAAVVDVRPPHLDITARGAPTDEAICHSISFNVYFEQGGSRLSDPAERTLDLISHHMHGCAVGAIALTASADDVASADGRRIAGLRGAAVIKALGVRGVSPQTLVIAQEGAPNQPASAAPQHLTVSIEASHTPAATEIAPRPDGEA